MIQQIETISNMHLEPKEIKLIVMTPDEYEEMPEDQIARVMELKRKLSQYDAMLATFVRKYTGGSTRRKDLDEVISNK